MSPSNNRYKLTRAIGVFFTWIVIGLKVYAFWSRIYRFIWHRQYSSPKGSLYSPLAQNLEPRVAQEAMDKVRWRPDRFKELWDAVGSPHWFQYVVDQVNLGEQQPSGANDCDEYATWAASVVNKSYNPHMLTVTWIEEVPSDNGSTRYKIGGHNLCFLCWPMLLDTNAKLMYRHLGNWGLSQTFRSSEELLTDILSYGGKKRHLLAWAIWTPDMARVSWGRDMKITPPL